MRVLLIVVGLALAICLVVAAGGTSLLPGDRSVKPLDLLASLAVYTVLACLLILLISGLRARPRKVGITLGVLSLLVLVAEGGLRLTYPPSWRQFRKIPSQRYHHVNFPGREMYWGNVEGTEVHVTTNEDGMRSVRTREEFLEFTDRVVVMGDSFTFGHSVRQKNALPQVMERELCERLERDDVAVLNAGVISYSPLLARRLFDAVIEDYKPTLVLYCLDATDIGDDYSYAKELVGEGDAAEFHLPGVRVPRYYGAVAELMHFDAILEQGLKPLWWIRSRLTGVPMPNRYNWYDFRMRIGGRVELNRYFIFRHPLEESRPYFEASFEHIQALADASRAVGAEFVLVVLPRFQHWNTAECPDNWERGSYALEEPYQYEYFRFFEEKAAGASFEILNLLPAFEGAEEFPLIFPRDPHWNDAGHAFVADVLAEHLIESRRLE